jgi:DNA-binding GntR family transcriptional regulator
LQRNCQRKNAFWYSEAAIPAGQQIVQSLKSIFPNGENQLIKQNLAQQLREQILGGRIAPGERIVEGTWARKFSVAQTSVREALNMLVAEGLVQKGHGRSARVVRLSEQDVVHMYQVRAVLEGLAARLTTQLHLPVDDMESTLAEMQQATDRDDLRAIMDCLLRFHLALCEKPRNPFLVEQGRRILIPLFAFTLIRSVVKGLPADPWRQGLATHRQMLDAIRSGDEFFAEHMAVRSIHGFMSRALKLWAHE